MDTALRLMLLGIALMLFHLVGGSIEAFIFSPMLTVYPELTGAVSALLPLAGIILALAGFFRHGAVTARSQ